MIYRTLRFFLWIVLVLFTLAVLAFRFLPRTERTTVLVLEMKQRFGDPCLRLEAVRSRGRVADADAVPALAKAVEDSDVYVRREAALALRKLADHRAAEALVRALRDGDNQVSLDARKALGRICDARAAPALAKGLRDDDPEVRIAVCEALARMGKPATPALIEGLTDANPLVRQVCAQALIALQDPSLVAPLVEIMRGREAEQRRSASWVVGSLGKHSLVPVAELLGHGDPSVRKLAAKTAAWACDSCSAGLSRTESGRLLATALLPLLREKDPDTVAAALQALRYVGDRRDIPRIVPLLQHREPSMKFAAVSALGAIGDCRASNALLAMLYERDVKIRCGAILALGIRGNTAAVRPLMNLLQDTEPAVRRYAALSLAVIRDRRAVPLLLQLLDREKDDGVLEGITDALGRIGDERAIVPLVRKLGKKGNLMYAFALKEFGSRVVPRLIPLLRRKKAVYEVCCIIEELKECRAVEPLIALLHDRACRWRFKVAEVLGKTGDPRAIEPLAAMAVERSRIESHVRQSAVDALGMIAHPRAFRRLVALLEDKRAGVREAAVQAIGERKEAEAFEILAGALGDESMDVRKAAVEGLGHLKDPRAVDILLPLVKKEPKLREVIVMVLGSFKEERVVDELLRLWPRTTGYLRYCVYDSLRRLRGPKFLREKGIFSAAEPDD